MESSVQLNNFARISKQLPRLNHSKKKYPYESNDGYKDARTLYMRWPNEILKVHKSSASIKMIQRTIRNTEKKNFEDNQFIKKESVQFTPRSDEFPWIIDKYIRPGKQSPKAKLYYEAMNKKYREKDRIIKTPWLPQQKICVGGFCNYTNIPVSVIYKDR